MWKKECFGNIFEIKEKIKEDLHKIQDTIQIDGYNPDLVSKENEKMAQYHDIITKEEIYWRKRSRSTWLNEGDKNTQFFHLSTLKHRTKTHISFLKKGDLKLSEDREIKDEMISFFSSLMTVDPNIDLGK